MAPSRRGNRKATTPPAPVDGETVWDPYAQLGPQVEEVWDPNIEWEVDRIVGKEISSDGTKHYEVRWGANWQRDDGSNTTWVSEKDEHDDVIQSDLPEKFERTLEAAAKKKAKVSESIDLESIMIAWPHDRETALHAEAFDEKLANHHDKYAHEYNPRGHRVVDWDSDVIRLKKDAPIPPLDLQRQSSMRSESRTLSDVGTPHPQPFRAPSSRPVRQKSASLRSESQASTWHPDPHSPRAPSIETGDIEPNLEPVAGRLSAGTSSTAASLTGAMHSALKALETQWSNAAQADHAEGLLLVNDVDEELPAVPPDFQWIENTYIFLPGRHPEPQYLVHCQTCNRCEAGDICNCINGVEDADLAEGAYADEQCLCEPLIDRKHGFIVRECNLACNCEDSCRNKVSQAPRNWTLEIFKTRDNRGWGVRTRDYLERGKVLGLYTGVLRPPANHDDDEMDGSIGNDYAFALDGGHIERDADEAWSVNSYRAGNWTRFVNHSCDPNMRIYSRVTGEYIQPASDGQELYYIVFVAKKDIPANTELTFDYRPGTKRSERTGRQTCYCKAKNCRGYVYAV